VRSGWDEAQNNARLVLAALCFQRASPSNPHRLAFSPLKGYVFAIDLVR